jgi:raffinose/stachyose/melibiose transport system substrate-binding protein
MKHLWRKGVSAVLAVAMMASFAACSKGGSSDAGNAPKQETVTLNVWHEWVASNDPQTAAFANAVKQYEKDHSNVKIQLYGLEDSAYKTKIATEFAGDAKNVDVFVYWAPGRIQKLLKADKLLPIDEYVSDSLKSEVKKGTMQSFEYDGKLYGLPMNSFMMLLFCNSDVFQKAGAKIPTTYDELLDASAKISKLDGVTPLALGAKEGWLAGSLYEALAMEEVGAKKVNDVLLGKEPFADKGFRTAAEKMVGLVQKGVLGKSPLEDGSSEADAKFLNGKAAMRYTGSWFCGAVDSDPGDVKNHVSVVKFPVTGSSSNPTDYCGGSNSSFFVNKGTKNPKEAADFAVYITHAMGTQAMELGAGYSTWTTKEDESKLGKTFKSTLDLYNSSVDGVLTWDTTLEDNPASIHLEQAQSLLVPNADIDAFMQAHQENIGKQQ